MLLFIFIPLIYFLVVFQTSFLVFFDIRGYVFNLVFLVVLLFNIFENQKKNTVLILAIVAGFFLDIFSSGLFGADFIGFWVLTLFAISLFIKRYFKKWINISITK